MAAPVTKNPPTTAASTSPPTPIATTAASAATAPVHAKPSRLGRGLSSLMGRPVSIHPPASPAPHAPATRAAPSPGPTPPPTAPPAAATSASDEAPRAEAASASNADRNDPRHAGHRVATPTANLPAAPQADTLVYLAIADIRPNPHQPRQHFDQELLKQLAESITAEGLIQPIIVRPAAPSSAAGTAMSPAYELVAGERRWRAAQIAGLDRIPSVIRILDDRHVAEWALVENLQREDLNPIERAEAFDRLMKQYHLSHEAIAGRLGLDRSSVSNHLRLLALDPEVQNLVRQAKISLGQAKVLAGVADLAKQRYLALRTVSQAWSVRQLESAARLATGAGAPALDPAPPDRPGRPAHFKDLQDQIGQQLGARVWITPSRRKGAGRLTIEFRSVDHFDELLRRLAVQVEV